MKARLRPWDTAPFKGCLSNKTALAMAFKLVEATQSAWRRFDASNQLPPNDQQGRSTLIPVADHCLLLRGTRTDEIAHHGDTGCNADPDPQRDIHARL